MYDSKLLMYTAQHLIYTFDHWLGSYVKQNCVIVKVFCTRNSVILRVIVRLRFNVLSIDYVRVINCFYDYDYVYDYPSETLELDCLLHVVSVCTRKKFVIGLLALNRPTCITQTCEIHRESNKTLFLPITSANVDRFSTSFTNILISKHVINWQPQINTSIHVNTLQ